MDCLQPEDGHVSWVLDSSGYTYYQHPTLAEQGLFELDEACKHSLATGADQPASCKVNAADGTTFNLYLRQFEPLDLILAVGIAEQSIEHQAKQKALKQIARIRYGEGGQEYLFALQYDGIYLSHLVPKYIGLNLIDITDPKGVKINQEIIKTCRNGSGYVHYVWDRYKTGQLVEKVSYVRGYQDWQWAIGTGFYLDTLFETQNFQNDLVSLSLERSFRQVGITVLLLFGLTAWLAYRIFRGFNQEISRLSVFFEGKIDQLNAIDESQFEYDEFQKLAASANRMLAARESAEAQLLTVFNSIDDVIYVADPDTYELLFVNDTFKKSWGEVAPSQKCYKVLQNRETPCDFCTNQKIFGDNLGNTYTWELKNEVNGHWYGIVDRAIEWHDGRMVRFEHARDITDKKLAEIERENYQQRLEQAVQERTRELSERSQQLEQANRDLEGFSYSVSHDLRSPLRAIDGFIAILKEDYSNKLDEEGHRLFSIVQDNARKMGELIDDILAFSRAGRFELEKSEINMNKLVQSAWNKLSAEYPIDRVDFACSDLPPASADPNAIRQVISNLLSNALKFSSTRETPVIRVNGQRIEGKLHYSISDNGVGFNNEYRDKLFVMFQRLHGMDEFEGTGVGLAIVKRFIEKHGGHINAEGIVDQGATFSFELPVANQ